MSSLLTGVLLPWLTRVASESSRLVEPFPKVCGEAVVVMHFAVAFLSGAPVTPANLLVSRSQCGLSRLRREAYSASQRSARICEFPKQRPAIRAAASTLEVTSDTFEEEVLKSVSISHRGDSQDFSMLRTFVFA